MKLNTLEKIYKCLLNEEPQIEVEKTLMKKVSVSINKMLDILKKLGL